MANYLVSVDSETKELPESVLYALPFSPKTIEDGAVVGDNLILTQKDGTEIDAGNVRGLPGPNTVPTNTAIASAPAVLFSAAKNPDTIVAGTVTGSPMTSAEVVWPDGTPGVLTIDARHSTGAVNSYHITYGSPVTKTYTQPTITRAADGSPTNVPQIVVS
jgi:hypothetical protein